MDRETRVDCSEAQKTSGAMHAVMWRLARRCNTMAAAPPGSATALFGTPLWSADLGSRLSQAEGAQLEQAVLKAYGGAGGDGGPRIPAEVLRQYAADTDARFDAVASASNNEFFERQRNDVRAARGRRGGDAPGTLLIDSSLAGAPSFSRLAALARDACGSFLRQCFALTDAEAMSLASDRRMFMWASVHAGGSSHPFHAHRDAVLSGVFYLRAPAGSGDFVARCPPAAPATPTRARTWLARLRTETLWPRTDTG